MLSSYAITIFAILWIGLAAALLANIAWLDILWDWVRALPLILEIIVWVIFLPITVGLWIWESSWSEIVRWLATVGMVGWTLMAISSFVKGNYTSR